MLRQGCDLVVEALPSETKSSLRGGAHLLSTLDDRLVK
jgi:hypothetical protein